MEKNWLIRTKSNYILGPVSKEKVIELYQNGSIKPDDEICSGNGYWFYIRESELVSRFLLGPEAQGFNPVSEAKNVLTATDQSRPPLIEEDITLIKNIKINPEVSSPPQVLKVETQSSVVEDSSSLNDLKSLDIEKKEVVPQKKLKNSQQKSKKNSKYSWLRFSTVITFIILLLLIYFRKTILHKILNTSNSPINFFPVAFSKENDLKKKVF